VHPYVLHGFDELPINNVWFRLEEFHLGVANKPDAYIWAMKTGESTSFLAQITAGFRL
jgi:hypothetical protein